MAISKLPESHADPFWMAEHRYRFDTDCAACHTVRNAGGSDNSSFCSNSACHGPDWQYIDFEVLEIKEMIGLQWPPPDETQGPDMIPHPINVELDCRNCHGPDQLLPFPEDHTDFSQEICTSCHLPPEEYREPVETPAAKATTPRTPVAAAAVPHPLEDRRECEQCHAPDSNIRPAPTSHAGLANDICLTCHQPPEVATEAMTTPTPTPTEAAATPTSTATPPAVSPTPVSPVSAADIPHTLEDREECMQCHAPDSDIQPAPPDHEDRPVDTCTGCHQPPQ